MAQPPTGSLLRVPNSEKSCVIDSDICKWLYGTNKKGESLIDDFPEISDKVLTSYFEA